MTLSIKNGGYVFLIRLGLLFSMSLWKGFQLLPNFKGPIYQTFNLYENDGKLLKFKKSPV